MISPYENRSSGYRLAEVANVATLVPVEQPGSRHSHVAAVPPSPERTWFPPFSGWAIRRGLFRPIAGCVSPGSLCRQRETPQPRRVERTRLLRHVANPTDRIRRVFLRTCFSADGLFLGESLWRPSAQLRSVSIALSLEERKKPLDRMLGLLRHELSLRYKGSDAGVGITPASLHRSGRARLRASSSTGQTEGWWTPPWP